MIDFVRLVIFFKKTCKKICLFMKHFATLQR